MNNASLVVALDVPSMKELERLVDLTNGYSDVAALKVGFSLALRFGLSAVVQAIKTRSTKAVIYDHQKAGTDIPAMGAEFASVCRDSGVDEVIIFPLAGPKTLSAFSIAARGQGLALTLGVMMSHPEFLRSDGGFICDDAPARIIEAGAELGVSSFVLPANQPEVAKRLSTDILEKIGCCNILMPGLGTQGGSVEKAIDAVCPHTPRLVLGSALYLSDSPTSVLNAVTEEMRLFGLK